MDERVVRGAALLDERMPGWANHIDLAHFDIGNGSECVLGQIGLCAFNTRYSGTAPKLLPDGLPYGNDARSHGFIGTNQVWDDDGDWKLLEESWRVAVLERTHSDIGKRVRILDGPDAGRLLVVTAVAEDGALIVR